MSADTLVKIYEMDSHGPIRYKDRQILEDIREWFFNRAVLHQAEGGLPTSVRIEIRLERSKP